MKMRKGIYLEGVMYQKALLRIITLSSMEKNVYDKPIDSNMKRYKEIRKFTTGKRGDYTAGYFSDYYNIKICHRLIVAYLSRQK